MSRAGGVRTPTASGRCGYRPSRSAARQLGRRGASREPATGPALRGFDCARDTALPPDPLALCGTQHLRIADAFRKQVVHEPPGANWGWPPCRVAGRSLPVSIPRPIQHPRKSSTRSRRQELAPACVQTAMQPREDAASLDDRDRLLGSLTAGSTHKQERPAHRAGCCSSREAAVVGVRRLVGQASARKTRSAWSPSWFLSRRRPPPADGVEGPDHP